MLKSILIIAAITRTLHAATLASTPYHTVTPGESEGRTIEAELKITLGMELNTDARKDMLKDAIAATLDADAEMYKIRNFQVTLAHASAVSDVDLYIYYTSFEVEGRKGWSKYSSSDSSSSPLTSSDAYDMANWADDVDELLSHHAFEDLLISKLGTEYVAVENIDISTHRRLDETESTPRFLITADTGTVSVSITITFETDDPEAIATVTIADYIGVDSSAIKYWKSTVMTDWSTFGSGLIISSWRTLLISFDVQSSIAAYDDVHAFATDIATKLAETAFEDELKVDMDSYIEVNRASIRTAAITTKLEL